MAITGLAARSQTNPCDQSVQNFQSMTGRGAVGTVEGKKIAVGNYILMSDLKIETSSIQVDVERFAEEGKTPVYVAINGIVVALVAVADPLKPTSREVIDRLQRLGYRVTILTGITNGRHKPWPGWPGLHGWWPACYREEKWWKLRGSKRQGTSWPW